MTVWNKLPIGGGGDLTFATLYHYGKDSGTGAFTYTTTDRYDFLIVAGNQTGTGQNIPNTSCSKGTLVASFYCNVGSGSTPSRQSVKIWQDVDSGAVINMPSSSSRRGIIVTGVTV